MISSQRTWTCCAEQQPTSPSFGCKQRKKMAYKKRVANAIPTHVGGGVDGGTWHQENKEKT